MGDDRRPVRGHNLDVWPGYHCVAKPKADGIFLNIDTAVKFINKTSIQDQILQMRERGYRQGDIEARFDSSNPDWPRKTVITSHNTRSY
jgi:hypothetical protein